MEIKITGENSFLLKGRENELVIESGKIKTSSIEINAPGEYEVGNVQILGVKANYKIKIDNVTIAIIFEELNVEAFEEVDILLSAVSLAQLVLKLEPKIVVVWGSEGGKLLREIGKEGAVQVSKLTVKQEKLPAELEAVWLK